MRLAVVTWKPLIAVMAALLLWAAPAEAAPKVVVVDMVKSMQAHPRTKVVEDNFRQAQEDAIDSARRTQEDVQTRKRELDATDPQDPEYLKKQKRYQQLVANANFNLEWAQKVAMREYTVGLEQIYGAVRGEISRYARDNGIEVVLWKSQPKLNAGDASDFALKSRLRAVIWADASVDITEDIVKRLQALDTPKSPPSKNGK